MKKEMNMEALQANLRMLNKKSEMAFEQAKAAGETTPEQEKANALLNDEAFLEKFFAAETVEDAQNLFKENGLDISAEELNGLAQYIAAISKKLIDNGGEISEEELEQIAGGNIIDDFGNNHKGFTEGELTAGEVLGTIGGLAGTAGGMVGGGKLGAIIGSCFCPGAGTAVGGAVGVAVGTVVGISGGTAGGFFGGIGIVKGVKKLGSWISSWF